ncbi:MAG: pentapeptide repeat-containing protein [Leptolyngbyaceae cyanobacterium RM1_406_9]|nr:pentapeptide repeat-containing protein [Leptolyngbyaceae cyanobacterium RM1_406_9]
MNQSLPGSCEDSLKIGVLISTDVILQYFTNSSKCIEDTEELLQLVQLQKIRAYITDYCLQKVGFYLSKLDEQAGQEAVSMIRVFLRDRIIYITSKSIEEARQSCIQNTDCAVEVACASAKNLSAIITLYPNNFAGANLSVLTANDFTKRQNLEELFQNPERPILLTSNLQDFKELDDSLQMKGKFDLNLFGIDTRNDLATRKLQDKNLEGVDLSSAVLRGADLRRCNLQRAILTCASLSFTKLSGADLRYADLRGANLSLANLGESDLSFADLSSSILSCVDLNNAQLRETNMRGADLQGANLQGANLQGADLQGANLRNAALEEANVELAKFGQNLGVPEKLKIELIKNGAIFLEEKSGLRSISIGDLKYLDYPDSQPN